MIPAPSTITRRTLLGALPALAMMPVAASAAETVDVAWRDLIPDANALAMATLRGNGVTSYDEMSVPEPDWEPVTLSGLPRQPEARGVTTQFDGKVVRMRGYVVPLDYTGIGVTQFILVPFAGACIHVPPPPANQLVFVTAERPYESGGLEEAVTVTGRFTTSAISTQLGEIGYELAATEVERYRWR